MTDEPTGLQLYTDDAGEWRWRFRDSNGAILGGPQEGYKNKGDCMDGFLDIIEEWLSSDRTAAIVDADGNQIGQYFRRRSE
jgi:uncharacterized protein YegP (UPF0339 family)